MIYTPLAGDPAKPNPPRPTLRPAPARIAPDRRHPCEVPVHPEESLPDPSDTTSPQAGTRPGDDTQDPDAL